MPINLDELGQLNSVDLATWMKPRPVDQERGDMLVAAAVEAVREAVQPRTSVPNTAKAVVLEAAARAYAPQVQQESLGSRSVSFFPTGDPRRGVFLTEEELRQLGSSTVGVGFIQTAARNGAGAWGRSIRAWDAER